MILAILLILSDLLIGYAFVSWARLNVSGIERLLYSIVTGFIIGSWILFVLYLVVGLNSYTLVVSIFFMIVASIRHIPNIHNLFRSLPHNAKNTPRKYSKEIVFFLFLSILIFKLFATSVFVEKQDGIYTNIDNIGDLPWHMSIISNFLENNKLEYPNFAYKPLTYHFLSDFITASLVAGGVSLKDAFLFVDVIFGFVSFLLFYFLALAITKSRSIAMLSVTLLLFLGGLGFVYFSSGMGAYNYTNYYENGIYFVNFLLLAWAQRALLLGAGMSFIVLSVVWRWFTGNAKRKELVFASVIGGLLPFAHLHMSFAVGFVSVFLFLINLCKESMTKRKLVISRKSREFALFLLIMSAFLLPQILWVLQPATGKLGVLRLQIGWISGEIHENWIIFLAKNLGLLFLLAIPAFFALKRELKLFYIPFAVLFFVANVMSFHQSAAGNLSIFYLWAFLHIIIFSYFINSVFTRHSAVLKLAAVFIVAITVLSGALSIFFQPEAPYLIFSKDEILLSEWVKANTPSDAVFLTAPVHNEFVSSLGGRRILMGHNGQLWSHGIDFSEREIDVEQMYSGFETAKNLKKYGVSYVVIGPAERAFSANESFFEKEFELVKEHGGIKVFKAADKRV